MRKKCMQKNDLASENLRSWEAHLGVVKLEEVSWLGHRQLGLKNISNCSTQLLVHVRAKATNWNQLTIGSRLLSPTKGYGYRTLQHNHHILYIKRQDIQNVLSLANQQNKQTNKYKVTDFTYRLTSDGIAYDIQRTLLYIYVDHMKEISSLRPFGLVAPGRAWVEWRLGGLRVV